MINLIVRYLPSVLNQAFIARIVSYRKTILMVSIATTIAIAAAVFAYQHREFTSKGFADLADFTDQLHHLLKPAWQAFSKECVNLWNFPWETPDYWPKSVVYITFFVTQITILHIVIQTFFLLRRIINSSTQQNEDDTSNENGTLPVPPVETTGPLTATLLQPTGQDRFQKCEMCHTNFAVCGTIIYHPPAAPLNNRVAVQTSAPVDPARSTEEASSSTGNPETKKIKGYSLRYPPKYTGSASNSGKVNQRVASPDDEIADDDDATTCPKETKPVNQTTSAPPAPPALDDSTEEEEEEEEEDKENQNPQPNSKKTSEKLASLTKSVIRTPSATSLKAAQDTATPATGQSRIPQASTSASKLVTANGTPVSGKLNSSTSSLKGLSPQEGALTTVPTATTTSNKPITPQQSDSKLNITATNIPLPTIEKSTVTVSKPQLSTPTGIPSISNGAHDSFLKFGSHSNIMSGYAPRPPVRLTSSESDLTDDHGHSCPGSILRVRRNSQASADANP